jgi:hypothetical protein
MRHLDLELLRSSALRRPLAWRIEASFERRPPPPKSRLPSSAPRGPATNLKRRGEGVGELGRKGSTRGSSGIAAGRCRGIGGPICDSYMIRGVFHKIATRAPGHRALPPRAREASWGDTYPRERGENSKGAEVLIKEMRNFTQILVTFRLHVLDCFSCLKR